MHEHRPSEGEGEYLPPAEQGSPPPEYARYQPTVTPGNAQRRGWQTAGGAAGAFALLAAKFKGLLLLLVNLKWLIFLPKLLFSFGGLFLSIWLYAVFFGWKFGIVFVLLILVHELGHYLTFRNFGIKADLPFFVPGMGAFVAARGPAPSLSVEAIATLAGPIFGLGASAICYFYGTSTQQPFWIAAAYVGFFLNALNLIPLPPFDGGGIANAIDPRLWILGAFGFVAFLLFFGFSSLFTVVLIVLVALIAIPRLVAMWHGRVDPRLAQTPAASRFAIAAAYFVTAAAAVAGAIVSHIDPKSLGS